MSESPSGSIICVHNSLSDGEQLHSGTAVLVNSDLAMLTVAISALAFVQARPDDTCVLFMCAHCIQAQHQTLSTSASVFDKPTKQTSNFCFR